MEIKTEEEYLEVCKEYENLKDLAFSTSSPEHERKIELVNAIIEYEEKNIDNLTQE